MSIVLNNDYIIFVYYYIVIYNEILSMWSIHDASIYTCIHSYSNLYFDPTIPLSIHPLTHSPICLFIDSYILPSMHPCNHSFIPSIFHASQLIHNDIYTLICCKLANISTSLVYIHYEYLNGLLKTTYFICIQHRLEIS